MRRLLTAMVCSLLAATNHAALAEQIPAPSGWQDTSSGHHRILTKGSSRLTIGPWQLLKGQSLPELLEGIKTAVSTNTSYISARKVKPERIEGAYSVTRRIKMGGKSASSVLYACPGDTGVVRIFRLDVAHSRFGDAISATSFIEEVCQSEPKGTLSDVVDVTSPTPSASPHTPSSQPASKPSAQSSIRGANEAKARHDLALANARIPDANRPVKAVGILEQSWRGFPAIMVNTSHMKMQFANGYATTCTNWNLVTQSPTPGSIGNEKCELTRETLSGKGINGFTPGETVNLVFGRISASGTSTLGSSSSNLSGGDLILSKDGRIAIGEFSAFSVNVGGGYSGAGGGKQRQVTGRYYLDGHTITIETDKGDILHSFIGWSSNKGSRSIDHVYFAGKHYWSRDE